MLASQARYVAVMDADLQHDEGLLVPMLDALRGGRADVAVASRYLYGGSAAGLSKQRSRVSRGSNAIVRLLLGIELTDPMSGHFMIRREAFEAHPGALPQGFKILLDILATARAACAIELPSTFRERQHGESKLDSKIALDFARLGNRQAHPRRRIGALSVVLHGRADRPWHSFEHIERAPDDDCLVVRRGAGLCHRRRHRLEFRAQQPVHLPRPAAHRWHFLTGLIRFQVICAIGAISNVGIATWIYDYDEVWWIAGLGGALIGTVWNFVVSAALVWRQR